MNEQIPNNSQASDNKADSAERNVCTETNPSKQDAIVVDSVTASQPREVGGRDGPDPTRFGDWEKAGRCIDF
jgi:hypothetical protein